MPENSSIRTANVDANAVQNAHAPEKTPRLSVVSNKDDSQPRLSRADVAERLGVSVATVRRYEGSKLHPTVDSSGAHWFSAKEVTALAASRANQAIDRGAIRNTTPAPEVRTRGEIAALVFERFDQRQSHAEVVIGLRVEPELVGELFEQYCFGLTERMLRKRQPRVPIVDDIEKVDRGELEERLAALPDAEVTRLSVGRYRGPFPAGEGDERADYAWIAELGGFHVSGPCAVDEITGRYGPGSYRITAYGFDPPGLRWEVLIEELQNA
jgi:AcrR family transcriptional regulator